jgi:hypothetical protein
MEFFTGRIIDGTFITSIIVCIQTIKQILKDKGFNISKNVWKIIVIIMGFPMAAMNNILTGWEGKTILQIIINYIVLSVIYSAVATLIYQTGKLSLNTFNKIKESKNDI